jgi:pimeloyl-ACP methyl ester carboxylesterase
MASPSLTRRDPGRRPDGLVLMLHGGAADGLTEVDHRSASWRRSRWMMDQISGRLLEAGVSVWLLRYAVRGWNSAVSSPPSPVPDARWALGQVRSTYGGVPVVLLGHSMGGRTAVAVADDPSVTGVVALAPWLPSDEPNATLRGKDLVAAHGRRDKITSARATREFVRRAERVAASAQFEDMGPAGHYMFRRRSAWNDVAAAWSLALLGDHLRLEDA